MESVRQAYLEMLPVSEVVGRIEAIPDWPIHPLQELFFNTVINPSLKYPPSKRWLKALFKKIEYSISEKSDEGMIDELTDVIINYAIDNDQNDDDPAYITYMLPNVKNELRLRVLRSHNQVGTRVWEAGLFLAEICVQCPQIMTGRVVLELGAGSGCTSLLSLKSRLNSSDLPRRVIITDNIASVLDNLEYNVMLNSDDTKCDQLTNKSELNLNDDDELEFSSKNQSEFAKFHLYHDCQVSVRHLDFRYVNTCSNSEYYSPDVILVADCNYDESLNTALVSALEVLLNPKISNTNVYENTLIDSSDHNLLEDGSNFLSKLPFALIAATVRNSITYEHFINEISNSKCLNYRNITDWAVSTAGPQIWSYDNRHLIQLILVTPKSQLSNN